MSWKAILRFDNAVWDGVEKYAQERINELTAVCVAAESTDAQIRQAQAGILEMERLKSLPDMLAAEAQMRAQRGARKEY